jgi:hypothetical protein
MTDKLDRLRALIAPSTEKEARERMRAYEAEATPGFVPAENEIFGSLDVAGAVRAMTDDEVRSLVGETLEPGVVGRDEKTARLARRFEESPNTPSNEH